MTAGQCAQHLHTLGVVLHCVTGTQAIRLPMSRRTARTLAMRTAQHGILMIKSCEHAQVSTACAGHNCMHRSQLHATPTAHRVPSTLTCRGRQPRACVMSLSSPCLSRQFTFTRNEQPGPSSTSTPTAEGRLGGACGCAQTSTWQSAQGRYCYVPSFKRAAEPCCEHAATAAILQTMRAWCTRY
jgi:hypothetical protein